jgi:crotonobetainyl-CoA:carnitine CoA-transferase CaiB-like acyl-CoA transferase
MRPREGMVIERDMLRRWKSMACAGRGRSDRATFSRTPLRVRGRASRLGEHNREVLGDIALDARDRTMRVGKKVR